MSFFDSGVSSVSEDKYSVPDWESIYGSLIAGVKVLYREIQELKELFKDFVSKKEFDKEVTDLKNENIRLTEEFKKETADLKSENNDFKTEIKTLKEELEKMREDFLLKKAPN